jgi:hypothetical protein
MPKYNIVKESVSEIGYVSILSCGVGDNYSFGVVRKKLN